MFHERIQNLQDTQESTIRTGKTKANKDITKIGRKLIYNPQSDEVVNDRRIFGGNPTAIFELNKIKYQWAYNTWRIMLANTWFPEEARPRSNASPSFSARKAMASTPIPSPAPT